LQSFEHRATVREVLAAQMEVSKNSVEDVINSSGGWNWMSSIARKCHPVRSTSYIKNCILSNLDNLADFKLTASIDGYAYSFLVFRDEGFEIELLWNCNDEYTPIYESKLEARVARLEKLITEKSVGRGSEPSNAMKVWSLLRDNGPMTRQQIQSSGLSATATAGASLKFFVDNDLLIKNGDKFSANLDYKWDDIGVIPRTAQQEIMNSVKNNTEAPVTRQSKRTQKATRQEPKAKNNLPDIKECIGQLEWKLDRDFDADDIHVWNEDNKLYANVLICGKAYGDSHTERYKVLYSVNVKDYGEGHYISIFDASKVIMQGDGVYDTSDLPSEQKSISVYTDFRGIESLTITYVMDYD
jgi:hypothetical protein